MAEKFRHSMPDGNLLRVDGPNGALYSCNEATGDEHQVSLENNREILRLIDANANRAREGIRTAEDYCRYTLNEFRWSGRLKAIRSGVTALLHSEFKPEDLIASRDVAQDPQHPKDVSTPPATTSESARSVAHRGLKRAQEALRVLEEYVRASSPSTSSRLSQHRYTLYEAEQFLISASDAARVLNASQVYVLLSSALCRTELLKTAEAVLKGGVRLLQLREKEVTDYNLHIAQARNLRKMCNEYQAVLFCNDRLDVALASGVSGVHVGQMDLHPLEARRIAGEKVLIGRSTHSVQQAKVAVDSEQVDYIAIGSIYDTSTKQGRILAGLALAEQVSALNLELPVFAIGGIKKDRIKELKKAGVRRIAVSTAVIAEPDPESAAREFVEAMAQ